MTGQLKTTLTFPEKTVTAAIFSLFDCTGSIQCRQQMAPDDNRFLAAA